MEQIPDDPIIRSIERSGYPPWLEEARRFARAEKLERLSRRPCLLELPARSGAGQGG